MKSTRFLRTVIAGCTLALLAAAPARAQGSRAPLPPPKPKEPRIPAIGPLANAQLNNAATALILMAQQLDEIATVKCDTDHAAVVAPWAGIVYTQLSLWSTLMQTAIEAGKLHMEQSGKLDEAVITSLKAQLAAQPDFINSAFGTGGGMLAEWKLDFNQRMANLAALEKAMPAIAKQLTADLKEVQETLEDIQAGLDSPKTGPTAADHLMQALGRLKTRIERVTRVVEVRQKEVEPYIEACAYPELKSKLEPILDLITPEQVAQSPNLSSIPAEVIQILQNWKTLLPKKCEDTYGPVWASAKKATDWVTDHKKLWLSLPLLKEARSFDEVHSLVERAKFAAKKKVDAIKARWSLLEDIKAEKEGWLTQRGMVESTRSNMASNSPTKDLLELGPKVKEAADRAEKAGAVFPEAKKFIEEQTLLVRRRAAIYKRWVELYGPPDGRLLDELMANVAKAPSKGAAEALWTDFSAKYNALGQELNQSICDNDDDMKALIDEGKLLLTLMK